MPTQKNDDAIKNAAQSRGITPENRTQARREQGQTTPPAAPSTSPAAPNKNLPQSVQGNFELFIQENKSALQELLPRHIDPSRLIRLALSAVRRSPELLKCNTASLIGAVIESSALGLEINTPLDQAYLLPFKDNERQTTDATLIIGYKGLIDLFYRHQLGVSIFAMEVYENDTFS
ncbi:MAG: hypothetical protein GF350_11890, partial [Chitinivibrionales bacterium]|nr:hypothetical protein [Chitinivibrionales bacterium]